MSIDNKSIISMITILENLRTIRSECFRIHNCEECMFQDTICGKETLNDWELELLKERIKERW